MVEPKLVTEPEMVLTPVLASSVPLLPVIDSAMATLRRSSVPPALILVAASAASSSQRRVICDGQRSRTDDGGAGVGICAAEDDRAAADRIQSAAARDSAGHGQLGTAPCTEKTVIGSRKSNGSRPTAATGARTQCSKIAGAGTAREREAFRTDRNVAADRASRRRSLTVPPVVLPMRRSL